jgi:hypothetical protein
MCARFWASVGARQCCIPLRFIEEQGAETEGDGARARDESGYGAKPRPAAFRRLAQVLGVDPLRLARESQRWEQGAAKQR